MVDTPNGLLGQRAVPHAQADYNIENASVTIQRNKMAVRIVHLWDLIKRKSIATRIFVQVGC